MTICGGTPISTSNHTQVMPTPRQLSTLAKYVKSIHEILTYQIKGLKGSSKHAVSNRNVYVRLFGQILYEAPKLYTGMASIKLVEQKLLNFRTKVCYEHHHSRQKGGDALVRLMDNALITGTYPTEEQVLQLALTYCQVHYTTAEENRNLRKHQRRCSSGGAYNRANIHLIEAGDLFTKSGKHTQQWKESMRQKYQPIIDAHYHPPQKTVTLPDMPLVIN